MRVTGANGRAGLNIATVVLVAAGIFLWFREPRLPVVAIPTAASRVATPGVESETAVTLDAGPIVASNMFSATRAAPGVRYTLRSAGVQSADASVPGADEAMTAPALSPPPRVYGTMTGPNGATALIQPDTAGASSRLYREGERVGAFRIEKILANSVVVRSAAGRLELKVEQREDRRE